MPDNDEIVVVGPSNPWIFPGGSPGGGGDSSGTSGPVNGGGQPPGPADTWRMSPNGRNECTNTKEGFNAVVYLLSATRTGRDLIRSAYSDNRFAVRLSIFDAESNNTYPGYDPDSHELTFDPYTFGSGTNPDGSTWRQSGIVIFAHELAHHMVGPNREPEAIAIGNRIAQELKSNGVPDTSTSNRVTHGGQIQTTSSVLDAEFGIHPPCNPS